MGETQWNSYLSKICRCEPEAIEPELKPYVYAFIRKDLPMAVQIVQTAHACQESGARFGCPDHCHMVLIGVKNERELEKAAMHLEINDIDYHMFYESDPVDQPLGNTAICTAPICGDKRSCLRRWQLYR